MTPLYYGEKMALWEEFRTLTGMYCDWPTSTDEWEHLESCVERLRRMKKVYDATKLQETRHGR